MAKIKDETLSSASSSQSPDAKPSTSADFNNKFIWSKNNNCVKKRKRKKDKRKNGNQLQRVVNKKKTIDKKLKSNGEKLKKKMSIDD